MYKRSSDNGCCFEVESVPNAVNVPDAVAEKSKKVLLLVQVCTCNGTVLV